MHFPLRFFKSKCKDSTIILAPITSTENIEFQNLSGSPYWAIEEVINNSNRLQEAAAAQFHEGNKSPKAIPRRASMSV